MMLDRSSLRPRRGPRLTVTISTFLAVALLALPARADFEYWNWFEFRTPIVGRGHGFPPTAFRLISDFRFNTRSGGLHVGFLRMGPVFDVAPFLLLAFNGTVLAERLPDGRFDQEARFEIEPTFRGRAGPFTFADRNRLESRWRASGQRFRYRNQLRVNYAPPGARVMPFAWDEMLFDLSGAVTGFTQNRFAAGIAVMLNSYTRLEVAYLLRSRLDVAGWQNDHGVLVWLFVDVPPEPTRRAEPEPESVPITDATLPVESVR